MNDSKKRLVGVFGLSVIFAGLLFYGFRNPEPVEAPVTPPAQETEYTPVVPMLPPGTETTFNVDIYDPINGIGR